MQQATGASMFMGYAQAPPSPAEGGRLSSIMELLSDENVVRRLCSANGSSQPEDCVSALRSLNLNDEFWMYEFKVVPCAKSYSHKWTLCPCAHAGETARRRCPRSAHYRAVLCPLVKAKKACPLGDACSYAHNVFEHWLHPSRYKTRLCSFGRNCNRPICFFAHSAEELRCMPNVDDGKELDEREYLLQLMLAQDSGHGLSMHGQGGHAGLLQSAGSMDLATMRSAGSMRDASGLQHAHSATAGAPLGRAPSLTLHHHMSHGPTSVLAGNSTDHGILLGLQPGGSLSEPLTDVTLGVDTLSAVSGAPHMGRISDPGTGHSFQHLHSSVHPVPHMNRISDSGQTLGLIPTAMLQRPELQSLLPLVNNAIANGQLSMPTIKKAAQQAAQQAAAQQAAAQQASTMAAVAAAAAAAAATQPQQGGQLGPSPLPPHMQSLSSVGSPPRSNTPPSPHQNGDPGSPTNTDTSARSGSPSALLASKAAAMAAAANGGNGAVSQATINSLMSQLQEMGLANSRDQLVASLSQLLAQLLTNS